MDGWYRDSVPHKFVGVDDNCKAPGQKVLFTEFAAAAVLADLCGCLAQTRKLLGQRVLSIDDKLFQVHGRVRFNLRSYFVPDCKCTAIHI